MTGARFILGLDFGGDGERRLRQRVAAAGLRLATDEPGRIIAVAPGTRVIGLAERGCVIGSLFAPGTPQALDTVSASASAAILGSSGQHLIQAYWGDYIAVLHRGEEVVLVRGPFGRLPCLLVRQQSGWIAASDIDALRLGGAPPFSLDTDAIARQLIAGDLRRNATCLTGIEEMRGGDRVTVTKGAIVRERIWTPWTFAAPARRIDDQAEAERRLRDQALACVARRTHAAAKPLLLLSGGLDSSIVAASLAAAGRDFACLNLTTLNPAGDERGYARAVAARINRHLVERDMAEGFPDIVRLAAVRLPRPVARSFEQHAYGLALEQAAALGCDALVDGGGGDNVFCSLQSASPAADCLLDLQGRPDFWRLCGDIGRLAETSRWTVAWRAFHRSRRARQPSHWPTDLRFLHIDAKPLAATAIDHPWLDEDALALPGRAGHIAMLVAAQGYAEDGPHGTKHNAISPLVAQPLIEHCLRIPSWHWFANGRNRAAARRAFAALLPTEVAWRESKGSPDSLLARLFETNRALLRDHLGDGLLATARIIDRDAVIAAIDDPRPAHGTGFGRILQLADTESWARGVADPGEAA
ncbi:asparagine synthase-related protein [Sphingomonas sp. ERG5]|uniref:asparagine synthase-related protein n=1 Tax=Sphingomonas sp. ERG5 TaxID=1381597 RepID=UPI00054B200C|nr:asparagine synthase-related protein [Sphingomonas sp. ERG5]